MMESSGVGTRQVPLKGHTILLMKSDKDGIRSFRDYKSRIDCFQDLDALFDQNRIHSGEKADSHDMNELCKWIDGFETIEMLIFDSEIMRYKRILREEMKELLIEDVIRITERKNLNEPQQESPTSTANPRESNQQFVADDEEFWDE